EHVLEAHDRIDWISRTRRVRSGEEVRRDGCRKSAGAVERDEAPIARNRGARGEKRNRRRRRATPRVDAHALCRPGHSIMHEHVTASIEIERYEIRREALEHDKSSVTGDGRRGAWSVSLRPGAVRAHALGRARETVVNEYVGGR